MYAPVLRSLFYSATVALLLLVSAEAATATPNQGRLALVIGNKNYPTAPLQNTINDASAIAEELESIGFAVTLLVDVPKENLIKQIAEFYRSVAQSDNDDTLAVFYYAGHAIQIDNRNYLVPPDANLALSNRFLSELFDINNLFAQMPSMTGVQNIVILDACRNNPFGQSNQPSSFADGLAPLRAPSGTLIAYATEPGNVAEDGKGKHGTYTKYLLRHLKKRITIEEVLKKVRKDVVKATKNRQIPWEHSSLLFDVFINPPKNRKMPDLMSF